MFISNLCSPLFVFKRGFLGSLFIVFVKVIIWVNSRLVHCWARGKHFFHLKELTLLVVIKFWGVGGVFVFRVGFPRLPRHGYGDIFINFRIVGLPRVLEPKLGHSRSGAIVRH